MARARLASLVVATAGALYFGLTAARDLQPFDSTEFALNAVQLGVGHPPGQPLYLLLSAGAVRLLRFLSPSHALAWLSIAATVGAAAWAIAFALRGPPAGDSLSSRRAPGLVIAAGLGPFLLPGVWDMATRAEVYPLAALCLAGAVFIALHHRALDGDAAMQHDSAASQYTRLALVGLLLGLGAAVNPAMAVAAGVALAPHLVAVVVAAGLRRGLVGGVLLVAGGLAGLLPYAVLPIIGAHPRDALVWGEPLRGDALAFYLLGRDYRAWRVGGAELVHNLGAALAWLLAEGILPWLVLGTLGLALTRLPRTASLVLPVGALGATALLALNHPFIPSNPDYDGYLLPWVWLSSAGVALLVLRLPAVRPCGTVLASVATGALVIAGLAAPPSLLERRRGASHTTRAIARNTLEQVPQGAILLVESDHLAFGTLYLQEIDHCRRDVTVVNIGWANSSWYLRYLARRATRLPPLHPDAPSREARVAALLAEANLPVAAERLSLASLGGPPCMRKGLAYAGRTCDEHPVKSPFFGDDNSTLSSYPSSWLDGYLSFVGMAAHLTGDPLDERLATTYAIGLAMDYLRWNHDAAFAFRLLRQAARPELLHGLREEPPPPDAPVRLTPLVEPRALLPQGALLLRIGDLLASVDRQAATDYFRRADLPEAEGAAARLLDGNAEESQARNRPADLAPTGD